MSGPDINGTLLTSEGYIEDTKADGSKWFVCKQCDKEIKTEQGIKCHISSKHNKQSLKRINKGDESKVNEETSADDHKKARYGAENYEDFEFDPLQCETSSQIAPPDILDQSVTTKLCNEYLQRSKVSGGEYHDFESVADRIIKERAAVQAVSGLTHDKNLINLNDTLLSSSEDEKIKETTEQDQFKITIENLTSDNKKLQEIIKEKDDVISLLTAKNDS